MFIPEYKSYSAACVLHSTQDTFFSSNLYSIGMNYAAMDGNSAYLSGINTYNLQMSLQCAKYFSAAHSEYSAVVSKLEEANTTIAVRICFRFFAYFIT